jgi:DNA-binding beta-propeller fold protein YncE
MGTATSTPLRYVSSLNTPEAAFGAGLLVSPDGTRLYVSNAESGTVAVLSIADGSLMHTIAICSTLGHMCFVGNNLLIADNEGCRLAEVTTDGLSVRSIPTQHRVSAVATNGTLIVAGRCDWQDVAVPTDDSDSSFGSGSKGGRILLYNAHDGNFMKAFGQWGTGAGQLRICAAAHFSTDGLHIIVAGSAVGEGLHVFTTDGVFVKRVLAGSGIGGPSDFGIFANYIVLADANGNAVRVYQKTNLKLVQELQPGEDAFACPTAVTAHGSTLYILNRHCNRVDVFAGKH